MPQSSEPVGSEAPVLARLRQSVSSESTLASSAMWAGASPMAKSGLQFAVNLVLARLLMPSEFGLAALATVVAAFATLFTELGIFQAVVQRVAPSQAYLSTAFWVNAASGVVLTGLLILAAPTLARFFEEPRLTSLVVVASLNLTASAAIVHQGLLDRTFHFRRVAMADTIAAVVGVATSLACGFGGLGPMSLVLGPLVGTCLRTALLWSFAQWRPSLEVSRAAASQLWRYTRGLVGARLFEFASRSADLVVLGRTAGVVAVGQYQRALNLATLPVVQLGGPLGRLLLPIFTRSLGRPDLLLDKVRFALHTTLVVTLPIGVALSLFAVEIIEALYGDQWRPAASILQVLVWIMPIRVANGVLLAAIQSTGRTEVAFTTGAAMGVIDVSGVLVGASWGALGVAVALVVSSAIGGIYFIGRTIRHVAPGERRPVGPLWRPFAAAAAMAAVSGVLMTSVGSDGFRWLPCLAAGFVTYATMEFLIDRQLIIRLNRTRRNVAR